MFVALSRDVHPAANDRPPDKGVFSSRQHTKVARVPNSPSALPVPHDAQIVPRYASRGTSIKLERKFNGEGGRKGLHFWRSDRPRHRLDETAHRLVRKGLAGCRMPQDCRSAAMTSGSANANSAAVKRDIH